MLSIYDAWRVQLLLLLLCSHMHQRIPNFFHLQYIIESTNSIEAVHIGGWVSSLALLCVGCEHASNDIMLFHSDMA